MNMDHLNYVPPVRIPYTVGIEIFVPSGSTGYRLFAEWEFDDSVDESKDLMLMRLWSPKIVFCRQVDGVEVDGFNCEVALSLNDVALQNAPLPIAYFLKAHEKADDEFDAAKAMKISPGSKIRVDLTPVEAAVDDMSVTFVFEGRRYVAPDKIAPRKKTSQANRAPNAALRKRKKR